MQGLPSWSWRFNLQLVQLMERFSVFFLSYPAPGVKLWFYPHLCMWSTHRSLVLRPAWSSSVCPSEARVQRWYDYFDHGSPGSVKFAGKLAATGARDMALVRVFPDTQHKVREGQLWGGIFYCSAASASMWGERGYNRGSSPCMWLSSSALLPWQSGLPP